MRLPTLDDHYTDTYINESAIQAIQEEKKAREKFGLFNSSHEALGVILEEYQELIDAVRMNDPQQEYDEAIQLAAMVIRFAGQSYNRMIRGNGDGPRPKADAST